MPKKLYELQNFMNIKVRAVGTPIDGYFYFDKMDEYWRNGNYDIVGTYIIQNMHKEIWEPFVEKPKVEFQRLHKWIVKNGTAGALEESHGFYYDNVKDVGDPFVRKIENNFIVRKRSHEGDVWEFVRHSSQEITKDEVENEQRD